MKELIFKSGKTVEFIECYGYRDFVQNVQREVLDFRFDVIANTLDGVDALFTPDECSELTIRETKVVEVQTEDENGNLVFDEYGNPVMENVERTDEFLYQNYAIRAALSKQLFTLTTENGVEDVEQISVKIAQQTETEKQLATAITELELNQAYAEGVNSL